MSVTVYLCVSEHRSFVCNNRVATYLGGAEYPCLTCNGCAAVHTCFSVYFGIVYRAFILDFGVLMYSGAAVDASITRHKGCAVYTRMTHHNGVIRDTGVAVDLCVMANPAST